MKKLNMGNTKAVFQPSFLDSALATSKKINAEKIYTPEDIMSMKAELENNREEIKKVFKFLNQDIVVLTGLMIKAKKNQAFEQSAISIFDFVGNVDKAITLEAEVKEIK